MCIEDFRLGRQMQGAGQVVQPAATSSLALKGQPNRSLIVFNAPTQGRVTFSIAVNAIDGQGITLNVGDAPVILDIKKHGDLVTRPWSMIGVALIGRETARWTRHAETDNAVGTLTVTGVAGITHTIDNVASSYNAVITFRNLEIIFQLTRVWRQVHALSEFNFNFINGLLASDDEDIIINTNASGTPGDDNFLSASGRTFISSAIGSCRIQTEELTVQ